ncbi:MAG: insulinase family protein [Cytophagales bacterium]|nr:insulinase family protein [Cytophagales bacterium]
MKDFEMIELPNGIRLIHKQARHTKVVHCGFVLDIGSRDELPNEQGIAHFWEHMAFKGTEKRKAYHILSSLDAVGGELNAYTTKEKICFHASVLNKYFDKACDVLADITFSSVFPDKQIEKERGVILEEMALYRDTPEDAIQDEFDELIFPEHSLGRNILGSSESVRRFQRSDFEDFIRRNMSTGHLVFASVGDMPAEKAFRLGKKYLDRQLPMGAAKERSFDPSYQAVKRVVKKPDISQTHVAVGTRAYGLKHPDRLKLFMLTNLLGGPGMNSRLNLSLREKYGLVYHVEANYTPFTDTGIFALFFATEPSNKQKAIQIVLRELRQLREKPLGSMQLKRVKDQLIGQLAMAEENNLNILLVLAKSILDLGKVDSLDQVIEKVNSVTAEELQRVAQEVFSEERLSQLVYEPKEE